MTSWARRRPTPTASAASPRRCCAARGRWRRAPSTRSPGEDYTLLDLNTAAFDLSDRGVAGLPHPGPLDAFVWLDRGIYRPGETVQVMALLRDDAGRPPDIPARVIIKRPNGQVFLETTPARIADASLHLPVTLSAGAPVGTWTRRGEGRSRPAADRHRPISASTLSCPTAWRWILARPPARWFPAGPIRCR